METNTLSRGRLLHGIFGYVALRPFLNEMIGDIEGPLLYEAKAKAQLRAAGVPI
jgi:hypothetical protein